MNIDFLLKKKYYKVALLLLMTFISSFLEAKECSQLTYRLSGGRLGDNILMYLRAKYVAKKYDLDFVYKPFDMAEYFLFHELEGSHKKKEVLQKKVVIQKEEDLLLLNGEGAELPYFSDFLSEYPVFKEFPSVFVDWNDAQLKEYMRYAVTPICELPLIYPEDPSKINVAIHLRYGSGQDDEATINRHPLKFPPIDFYANQVLKIYEHYGSQPLEVFLFTDAKEPKRVAAQLLNSLKNIDVEIRYKEIVKQEPIEILQDFFSLQNFDCLIRPESSFSYLASLIKDYEISVAPFIYQKVKGKVKITAVEVQKRGNSFTTIQHEQEGY